jgi:dienelactone hydrolase
VLARQCELLRLIVEQKQTPKLVLSDRADLREVVPDHFTDDSIYRRTVTFYHQLQEQALSAAWSQVQVPVLSIHGSRDWICTLQDSARIASLVKYGNVAQVAADHQMSDASSVRAALGPSGAPDSTSLRLSPALRDSVVSWLRAMLLKEAAVR